MGRSVCLARRRRSKLVAAIADKSPCRNLAFAFWARFGPRFPNRPLADLNSGGLQGCSRDCVGTCHGTLWMRARQRIRRPSAHRTKNSLRNCVDGDWFSFAHGVLSLSPAPGRCSMSCNRRDISAIAITASGCRLSAALHSREHAAIRLRRSAMMLWTCSAPIYEDRPMTKGTAQRSACIDERASLC